MGEVPLRGVAWTPQGVSTRVLRYGVAYNLEYLDECVGLRGGRLPRRGEETSHPHRSTSLKRNRLLLGPSIRAVTTVL